MTLENAVLLKCKKCEAEHWIEKGSDAPMTCDVCDYPFPEYVPDYDAELKDRIIDRNDSTPLPKRPSKQ